MAKNPKGGWQGGEGPWGRPPSGGSNNGGSNNGNGPERPNPELERLLKRSQDRMRAFKNNSPQDNSRILILVIFGGLLLWLASGIYIVQPGEQGVVMRFGKFHRTTLPGPNYHMPYPVETVETPNVEAINRIQIGSDSEGRKQSNAQHLMLTRDENLVDMNFEVQWKISDAEAYLFNIRNPEDTIRAVAESTMREAVGRTAMANELSQMRESLASETKRLMQETLTGYKSGIEVVSVNIKELTPPTQVIDAFYDVQRAKADQESRRNEAESYSNDILPRARGEAEQMLQKAEAYKQEVVARAKGDASRFSAVYEQYLQAKSVTKKRIYLETIEQVLKGMDKVIVEGKSTGGGVVPVLPLSEMKRAEPAPLPKAEGK